MSVYARDWRLTGGSAEVRFEALLETARMFWRALDENAPPHGVEEIVPTLRLAHKIGEQGVGMFVYRDVRLSAVVDGVPIVKLPSIHVSSPQASLGASSPNVVIVQIGAHQRAIEEREIAQAYRESLEAAGEHWGGKGWRITCAFHGDELYVDVERGAYSTQDDGSLWPSPSTVGRQVKGALEEFAEELQLLKAGRTLEPKNLIPATVVQLLRDTLLNNPFTRKDGKTDRQGIQRLVARRVFCEEPSNFNRWPDIWEAAGKIAKMEDRHSARPMRLARFGPS
jgi:hypothetical protein